MNKRQKKKKAKKYLPIIADEFNLLTMTDIEYEKALKDYKRYRERFAYCKRYKDLKNGKPLRYFFPVGEELFNGLQEMTALTRKLNTK